MLRQSLLLGIASLAFASTGHAQRGQSRDDLLDALTRHIQICTEMTDSQSRLACYDRMQNQVGGTQPTPTPLQPTPTPLQASPASPPSAPAPTMGSSINSAPLSPQPLAVPGGGVATLGAPTQLGSPTPLGGPTQYGSPAPPPVQDPNAAFDPRSAAARPPATMGVKPQPTLRRSGPRPIPSFSTPQPLVTLGATNLTYGDSRYWQVTVTMTSNTPQPINAQAECTFMNGGRPVSTDYLGPLTMQPGEQVTTELIGPPTTTYVDSSNCKITSP
jgi:hypothetical protein